MNVDTISKIEEKCKKYPGLRYHKDSSSITISPAEEDGFPVSYTFSNDKHMISFLGWHEEFNDEDEALNCLVFGLSNECRLRVMQKGNFQYKWTVEAKDENGNWIEDSTTGLLFFPFWKKTMSVVLQNNIISEKGDVTE